MNSPTNAAYNEAMRADAQLADRLHKAVEAATDSLQVRSGEGEDERICRYAQSCAALLTAVETRLLRKNLDVFAEVGASAGNGLYIAKTHGSMGTTLTDIHNAAQTALQRPLEGTRVRCLMPHRGEQGEVVGWDPALGLPLIGWDSQRGLPPEACEPSEYEVIQ